MNRTKRPIDNKLRKKMSKAIRNAQTGSPSIKSRKTDPEVTGKQMLKEFPNRAGKKKEELVAEIQMRITAKKNKAKGSTSKRTTPGDVPSDSSPANAHREGKRWIKTTTKQILAQRAVETHRAGKK